MTFLCFAVSSWQRYGERRDSTLSLHQWLNGREFSVVVMFGMDDGRIPRQNSGPRERVEARRLFYVGFTCAKLELHIMSSVNRPSPFVLEVQERLAEEESD
jgi:superfamily I DNA/RNA helicase